MLRTRLLIPVLAFAVAALSFASTAQAAESAVRWEKDIDKALAMATQSNRSVLIHFWKPSCGPCVKLDAHVFSDPQFAAVLEADYVPVKINTDQLPKTAERFGIEFLPTDIILTPDGKVAAKTSCPADGPEYARRLRETASSVRRNNGAQYAQADRSTAGQAATRNSPTNYTTGDSMTRGSTANDYTQRDQYDRSQITATEVPPAVGSTAAAAAPAERRYANDNSSLPASSNEARYASNAPRYGDNASSPSPSQSAAAAPQMTSRDPATPNYDTQPEANALPYGRSSGQGIASNSASYAPRQEATQRPNFDPPTQRVQQTAAAGPPSLCLEGRCPVTFYDTQKWMHGDRRFGAVHRGRLFLFSSAAAQQRFLADPDKYSPAVSGHDAVAWVEQGQLVPGMMKFGGQYRNIVYLFSSEATLRQFEANPERYAAAVEQEIAAGRNQGQIRR